MNTRLSKMAEDSDLMRNEDDLCLEDAEDVVVENGFGEEPNFSDPEDYIDDITDDELVGDLLKNKPKETDGFESVIVVDGIPQVGQERQEKLEKVIHKIYSKFGKIITEHYPKDENLKTKGYVFLEYSCPAHALEAVKMTNGYKLDKQHTFSVNLLTDFDKYENVCDDLEPPTPQPYVDHGNLWYWLEDPDCYDQYSVIYEGGAMSAVFLNSHPEPTPLRTRERWTESILVWSPLGTYLATFHQRGLALWGGEDFRQIMKFQHSRIQFIDFSPKENYLVTFSPEPDNRDDQQEIIIWDVRTGLKKRAFHADHLNEPTVWPMFKWSPNDKYFARMTQETLSIYETPSFGLLDKKSLKVAGMRNFSWSPSDNIIAYWVAEDKDVPARVTLIEIPSRRELRAKNLFNVADCKMHWQKCGDYLCVKVDRYSKSKKEKSEWKYSGLYYNFEIFHMREKQIPVDSVEIKEYITAFAWEPVGSKFAVIHGETPHISVSFYGIKGGGISFLKKFERKQFNHLFWSPNGQFIVLAGLRTMNGSLEFVDTSDFTVMAQSDHFMATDVEWDPTGRYVSSGVSHWAHKVDNGYWLWTFQGKIIRRHPMDGFCQMLWRPRPLTLLSEEKIKEIKKNLKKYSAQFEIKDRMSLSKASKELVEKRKKVMEDFRSYRERKREEFIKLKTQRLELRDGVDTDELDSHLENLEEETVEFFVKEELKVIEE
ncbi:eukaryotic translation initiation factor 3 subunit B-like isoform X1 [Limulus polyphemus]|uniref:Eukaryotic translation initiation factor 3 subunit B n=1 Tax=Limulus polyphemus TaxID=6850 RepID=A0ABM1B4R7_LIMPO|nr:eukaryotic translation initiation factor 3 subunit B-like isoform X1 [Limulus polyphemus]